MILTVLLFKEGPYWVAQGLEYDIVAQGETRLIAIDELHQMCIKAVFLNQQLNLHPFELSYPKAPDLYWKRYEESKKSENGTQSLTIEF